MISIPLLASATSDLDSLLLSLFVIFTAAKISAEIFERLRQPAVVGEILAGVLIGPGALGLVAQTEVSQALAEIGVILLLFTVGLEVSPSALFKVGPRAMVVAIVGVVLPFVAGWGFMAWWGAPTIGNIFVGAAMVATSVGITARVLAGMNMLSTRSSQIILGAAVIDDILGLMVLGVVSSLAEGQIDYTQVALKAALAVGFTILMLFVGSKVAAKARPFAASLRIGNGFFLFALALCLGLSVVSTEVGIAPIIGAFLAGIALAEASQETSLHHEVGSVMEFLVPFFFVGIGLQLDLSVFADSQVVVLATIITLLAILTKLVGCGAAALPLGKRAALQVGMGMVPRGEVGIIVAQIGLGLGAISSAIYGVVVFMAIATTLVAPPFLTRLFKAGQEELVESGTEIVEQEDLQGLD